MTISFNYRSVKRPDGSKVRTPSIPIVLSGIEKFDTIGMLDSGADISAISREVAEIIGLDLSGKISIAHGIGGNVDAVDSKVDIMVEKGHEHYSFQMPVKVVLDNYDFPMLLGRNGFFDKFVITFDQTNEKVLLKKLT